MLNKPQPNHQQADRYAFKRDIDEINWSLATGNTDVNLSFEIFLRLIGKIIDKHAPMKKQVEKNKEKIKTWVTRGIRKSMKIRDKLYKQLITSKNKPAKLNKRLKVPKQNN